MRKKNKPGQGRKGLYSEPTKPVVTKVPESKIPQFRIEVKKKILKKWEVKKGQ